MSLAQRRALVGPAAPGSLRQQCQWVGLHRSVYYYQPVAVASEDLVLMRLLDEQYLLTPWLSRNAACAGSGGLSCES